MSEKETQTTADQIADGCMWLVFGFIFVVATFAALGIGIKLCMMITGMGS